jgi:hypothetical protein
MKQFNSKLTTFIFILMALTSVSCLNKYKFYILHKRFSAWRSKNNDQNLYI